MFLSKVVSSAVQILLFALIPFLFWAVTARKEQSFGAWIGLKKIQGQAGKLLGLCLLMAACFLLLGFFMLLSLRNSPTAVSEFEGLGIKAVPSILVYAVFQTAFPEELLFRGFLLGRLKKYLGFLWANSMQALLFGLVHGVLFLKVVPAGSALFIMLFTAAIAWTIGFIDDKAAGGSILPGWAIHAAANLFSGLLSAFALL